MSPLASGSDTANREAFVQGLRALGYVEGQNVLIVARHADGHPDRLSDLAAEIVRIKVDVIVTATTTAMRAVQQTTRTIPVVMAFAGDPTGDGLISVATISVRNASGQA